MGGAYRSGETGARVTASAASPAAGVSRVEFHSHNLDETREYIGRNYGDHSRVIRGKGKFLYRISAVAAGRVIVGRSERWLHQTLRASVFQPTLFLSLQPGQTISFGRRSHALPPDRAVFCAPDTEYTRAGGDDKSLVVRVESGLMHTSTTRSPSIDCVPWWASARARCRRRSSRRAAKPRTSSSPRDD